MWMIPNLSCVNITSNLSIKLKNYKLHHIVISVPLDEKQKRGRPVKNKGWWWKEKFVGKIVMVNLHPNIP